MNEQQRIFATVVLCMGIWLGWEAFFAPPPPSDVQEVAATPASPSSASPQGAQDDADSLTVPSPEVPLSGAPQPAAPAVRVHRRFVTEVLDGTVRNGDAALTALRLKRYNERTLGESEAEPVSLVATDEDGQAALHFELPDSQPLVLDFVDKEGLVLAGRNADGLEAHVEIRPRASSYALDYHVTVHNRGPRPHVVGASVALALTPQPAQPNPLAFVAPPADPLSALCDVDATLTRQQASALVKRPFEAEHGARWAALDRQYFVTALLARGAHAQPADGRCRLSAASESLQARFGLATQLVQPGDVYEGEMTLYGGPKRDEQLTEVDPALRQVINYNLWKLPLEVLARPMMAALGRYHDWTGSWGVSIMLLTLTLKLILFPVTYRSVVQMKRMQALKPEMDALRQRFGSDRDRLNQETLKLYRDKNVNPVSGCLPMLMQVPVWLTLYRTLWSAVDLYQQPFLWLGDLTAPEVIPLLGLTAGAVTIVQQRMTPMSADNPQAKTMMVVMPVMLTVFTIALPSGLVLYILTNSVLTILQQLAINWHASGNKSPAN